MGSGVPAIIDISLTLVSGGERPITARQLQAAVVSAVEVGHHSQINAYSAWPLMQGSTRDLALRVGWLPDTQPPAGLTEAGRSWWFGSPAHPRVAAQTAQARLTAADYEMISDTPPVRASRFTFHSPTLFKRSGQRRYPLPDPHLVFRGLAEKWNTFTTCRPITPEHLSALTNSLEVAECDIRTELMVKGRQGVRRPRDNRAATPADAAMTGFVGSVTFALAPKTPHDVGQLLASLSTFANFAGVGYATTSGFGACETS
ncbi:MAG: CRISPR-associated endoribonuclease Cas6 [Actinomycetota bacterium]|nr:CRISPR-associated endoribonuclease Cas6 [Actinomycetota bacterium]